jgi:hypothetical protein
MAINFENIRYKLDIIKKENDIIVKPDEIDYYLNHLDIFKNRFQKDFLGILFKKYLSPFDLDMMTRREYIEAIIIMKRILINDKGLKVLPYILSGNCIFQFPKGKCKNVFDELLNQLIFSKYTFVMFEDPDRLGSAITIDPDILVKDLEIVFDLEK